MSFANAATDASGSLVDVLANPAPAAPFPSFGDQTMDSIRQLADIFFGDRRTHTNPHPTPKAHPCNNTVTHAAGQL